MSVRPAVKVKFTNYLASRRTWCIYLAVTLEALKVGKKPFKHNAIPHYLDARFTLSRAQPTSSAPCPPTGNSTFGGQGTRSQLIDCSTFDHRHASNPQHFTFLNMRARGGPSPLASRPSLGYHLEASTFNHPSFQRFGRANVADQLTTRAPFGSSRRETQLLRFCIRGRMWASICLVIFAFVDAPLGSRWTLVGAGISATPDYSEGRSGLQQEIRPKNCLFWTTLVRFQSLLHIVESPAWSHLSAIHQEGLGGIGLLEGGGVNEET